MRRRTIAATFVICAMTASTMMASPAFGVATAPHMSALVAAEADVATVIATIATGTRPTDIVLDPARSLLYVLDAVTPRIVVISTTSNTVVGTIDVLDEALYLTLDATHDQLFVANGHPTLGPGSLSVIDTRTGTMTSTTALRGHPRRPVLDATRGRLYVAQSDEENGPGTLSTIDAASNTVLATVTIGVSPGDPALDAKGRRLYIPLTRTVAVYDTQPLRRVANVKVGQFPEFVVLDLAHRQFFAVRMDALVAVDARTNTVTGTVRMPISIEAGPPALDSARQRMYLPSWPYRGRITVLNTHSLTVRARITVGYAPDGPVLDSARRLLYVPEFDEGDGHSVYVIDAATNTVLSAVGVGKGPLAPALDAGSGRLYVPSWGSGSMSVIDPGR